MKVLLLNMYYAPDEGASAQILTDLGAGLARAGHEVHVVTASRGWLDPTKTFPARETIDGVDIRRSWASGFGRGTKLGRVMDYASFGLTAALRLPFQTRPDVVLSLSNPPLIAWLGLAAARFKRCRALYWVMDIYPEIAYELGVIRPGSIVGRLLARLSRFTLRRSDRVVVLGDHMARRLAPRAGREFEVIHNWANGVSIVPLPREDHPLRGEWGWDDKFVVAYSGNMGLPHEFDTVLDAAAQLRDLPDVHFAFIGGGLRKPEIEAGIRERGLDNVEFRPFVPRAMLGRSLTAADVQLITLRKGMPGLLVPSKIYGILAAGRPTLYIGPADGEVFDIIREGSCGSWAGIGDAAAAADAIRRYRDDAPARLGEGRRAREVFDANFGMQRGIDDFERILREMTD